MSNRPSSIFSVGIGYMLLAVLFFSMMSVLAKLISTTIPTGQIVFVRACVGTILAYWGIRLIGVHVWGNNIKLLLFRGIAGFGSLMCFFYTLIALPLAEATILFYTSPCLAAIIATILLRERLTIGIILGLLVCVVGVLFVIQPEFIFNVGRLDIPSVFVGLLGALMAALAFVSVRKLRETDHAMVIIFYFSFVSIFASAPFVISSYVIPSVIGWIILIGIGISTHIAQFFLTKSLHKVETSRAMGVSYIQVLFATGWGILIFGDIPNSLSILGMALVVAGSIISARSQASIHPNPQPFEHSP
ncbi:MAG: DMT family transporter [Bacteroidetes bacterium]|nr:DMT family transporter [Bacteroidota bacterium]